MPTYSPAELLTIAREAIQTKNPEALAVDVNSEQYAKLESGFTKIYLAILAVPNLSDAMQETVKRTFDSPTEFLKTNNSAGQSRGEVFALHLVGYLKETGQLHLWQDQPVSADTTSNKSNHSSRM